MKQDRLLEDDDSINMGKTYFKTRQKNDVTTKTTERSLLTSEKESTDYGGRKRVFHWNETQNYLLQLAKRYRWWLQKQFFFAGIPVIYTAFAFLVDKEIIRCALQNSEFLLFDWYIRKNWSWCLKITVQWKCTVLFPATHRVPDM